MKRSLLHPCRSLLLCGIMGFAPFAPAAAHAQTAPAAAAGAGQFGFASRLPQDVEMFSAAYNLGDVVNAIADSKFATALLNLQVVQQDAEFRNMLNDWRTDPDIQQFKSLAGAILGKEFAIVGPRGTGASLRGLLEAMTTLQPVILMTAGMRSYTVAGGDGPSAPQKQEMVETIIKALGGSEGIMDLLQKINPPPLYFVSRAGSAKPVIDGFIAEAMKEINGQLPPFVEAADFSVGSYKFNSLSVSASKALTPEMRDEALTHLTSIFGDKTKAKGVIDAASEKRAELAWGWVDDYFVVSIGKDHSHLKFAAGAADSALAIPAVAKHLGAAGTHKPLGLSFASKTVFQSIDIPMHLANLVSLVPQEIVDELKIDRSAVAAELVKIDEATNKLLHREFTDMVSVAWVENGVRQESWGGPKHTGPAPAPLAFAGTRTPATFLYSDGRSDWAPVREWIETCSVSLDKIYTEEVRPNLPPDAAQAAAIGEVVGRNIVSTLWKTIRSLSEALGDESALLVNLDGKMPPFPGAPKIVTENVPFPRIAWVCQLKNRAKLTEAWKSFEPLIMQALSFVPADAMPGGRPKFITTKDGGIEMWSIKLPMDLGDLNPHIAASADRWIWSTSTSFTKQIVAAPAAAGEPLTGHTNVNFVAAANAADTIFAAINKDPAGFFAREDMAAVWSQQVKADFDTIRKLIRCLGQIDAKAGVEGDDARASVHIQVKDLD